MKQYKSRYLLAIYVFLIIAAGAGYVANFKIFLVISLAVANVAGLILLQKLYEFMARDSMGARMKSTASAAVLVFAAVGLAGAVLAFFMSDDIGAPGFLLGISVYCLHSFILLRNSA